MESYIDLAKKFNVNLGIQIKHEYVKKNEIGELEYVPFENEFTEKACKILHVLTNKDERIYIVASANTGYVNSYYITNTVYFFEYIAFKEDELDWQPEFKSMVERFVLKTRGPVAVRWKFVNPWIIDHRGDDLERMKSYFT